MTFGVLAFIVALLTSVMIHEFGHYFFARRFGMKVTEFFVGFGPRLWSTVRGETEYGIKAIPAGGYVRIVGMTSDEPMAPEDRPRAFYSKSVPQRVIVLAAGSVSHFIIGFLLIVVIFAGLGTLQNSTSVSAVSPCVPVAQEECTSSAQPSPTAPAGLQSGDRIVAIDGVEITSWDQALRIIRASAGKEIAITVERAGSTQTLRATPVGRDRPSLDDPDVVDRNVGVLGFAPGSETVRKPIGAAITGAGRETGRIITASIAGLASIPSKVPALWSQTFGGEPRDPESLVGVYGVARASGQTLAADQIPWNARLAYFLFIIASLNIFVGLFNIVPLPPLDGGHILVALVDGVKRARARRRGEGVPAPFDITRLAPLTYTVFGALVFLTVMLLAADILNPINLGL
jgi:membrane-associated protease RseP (regulator of RpoE activity)